MPLLRLGNIPVEVRVKPIRHIHLTVHPPTGRVRISAPPRVKLETLRVFAASRIGWIRRQQQQLRNQERETPREFLPKESHFVWGQRRLMRVVYNESKPNVTLRPGWIDLVVRPGTPRAKKREIVEDWYRSQIRVAADPLIQKWSKKIGVRVNKVFVQNMKTKWGSCNPQKGFIRLNTELAKKPPSCLEYIVVHELIHLLEPSHNDRFRSLMAHHMPTWRQQKDLLRQQPLAHQKWDY